MDDPNRERLHPVYPPEHSSISKSPTTPFQRWARFIEVLSIGAIIGVLVFCAVMFAGFWENDQGVWHLISAFFLCFGAGLLAYGPLISIFMGARSARGSGPTRRRSLLTTLLVLPWTGLAGLWVPLGGNWVLSALFIWVLSLIFLFWAALNWHGARARSHSVTKE